MVREINFKKTGGDHMAKNKIQFQKGISFRDFMDQYGTEK